MQTIQSNNDGFQNIDGLLWNTNSYNSLETYTPKTTTKKKKKKKNALDYIGDFVTGGVSTAVDFLADVTEGGLNTLEGIVDTGTYALADTIDFIDFGGFTGSFSDDLRKNASFDSTASIFGHSEKESDNIFGRWQEGIEEKSWAPDFVDQIGYGLGNVGMNAALAYVTGGQSLAVNAGITFASSYGNAKSKALRDGLSEEDARKAGFISGAAETISEQFFNGLPGFKSSGWGEKLTGKLANKVTNYLGTNAGKITLKVFDALGEGSEEIISNALTAAGNDIFHYFDKDFTYGMENQSGNILEDTFNAAFSSESGDAFISAAIVSGLLGAGQSAINAKQRNDIIKAYAKDYNMDEKDARYILTGEQLETAKDEIKRDNIEYNSEAELDDMAQRRILNYMKETTHTNVEQQLNDLENDFRAQNGRNFTEEERNARRNFLLSRTEDQVNSPERYREFLETASGNESDLAKSMADSGLADTELNHKLYNFVDKLQKANPNSKYKFVTNDELVKMGILEERDGQYGLTTVKDGSPLFESKTINGFKKGDTIYINSDLVNKMENGQFKYNSNEDVFKYYKTIIGHELGEAIKSSDLDSYNNLKSIVKEIYGETSLDEYKALYGENLTDNVEDEYVNDKLGELFENDKLINKIADDRNLLQKFIDEIKKLVKYLSSSKEQRQLQKLQQKLEDKYIELYKKADFNRKVSTAFSIKEANDGTKYVQIDKPLKGSNINEINKNLCDYIDNLDSLKLILDDQTELTFVKELGSGKKESGELAYYKTKSKNLPYYKKITAKQAILNQIEEALEVSKYVSSKNDVDERHAKLNIKSFDSRNVIFYDGTNSYKANFNIANLNNGLKVPYAIRQISRYNSFNEKITQKKNEDSYESAEKSTDELTHLRSSSNIPKKQKNVNNFLSQNNNSNEDVKFSIGISQENNFSYDSKAKRYSDLLSSSFLDFVKRDDGNINVFLKNENNDIIKKIAIYADSNARKQFGDEIGGYIFKNAKDKIQSIRIGNDTTKDDLEVNNIKDTLINDKQSKYIDYAVNHLIENMDVDKITDFSIDNVIENSPLFNEQFIDLDNTDSNEMKMTPEEVDEHNEQLYDKIYNQIVEKFENEGLSARVENGEYVYDRQKLALKGYNELLDYLDSNNINYEISRSTNPGHVPSIYIKDADGSFSFRVANHENGYISEYDMTYLDSYNHLFNDKDYIDWKNKILPLIKRNLSEPLINDYNNDSFSLSNSSTLESGHLPYLLDKIDNAIYEESLPLEGSQEIVNSSTEQINLPVENDKQETVENDDLNREFEDRMSRVRQKLADERFSNMMEKQTYKSVKDSARLAKNYLDFNSKQTEEFKNQISKLAKLPKDNLIQAKNYNKLKNIIKQYANKDINFVNEELKSAQRDVRNRELIVSDDLKKEITDWSDFRRSSGLNIKSGLKSNVDVIYEELLDTYPGMLDNNLTNYADQLQELKEFVKRDNKFVQHFELNDDSINQITTKVWEKLSNSALTKQEMDAIQNDIKNKLENRTREVVRRDLLEKMGLTEDDIAQGKDISSIAYQRTDPNRLNEKVFGLNVGRKINLATAGFVKSQEANKIRFLNKERSEIKDLGIKARSKESAAVQKFGEKQYVNDKGEVIEYTERDLIAEFKDQKTIEKIKHAAEVLRQKYDKYIDMTNASLIQMGYDPIPKRQDYFKHFMEIDTKLSKFGWTFSKENIMKEELPTDINGLTADFKPGKNYFASALKRKGLKTTYDAITGIDSYLEGAGNLIYHTESIQRYRALSKLIRDTYGQQHGLENIELMTPEDAEQRLKDVYDNKLSRYAAWLDEQANALAGKKAQIDRSVERVVGRKGYTFLNALKKQVGSNMTGYNIRSSLTNFASAIQGASKTEKLSALQGFTFALKNYRNLDPLVAKSDFLATRFGSDSLSKKMWQKISDSGQVFMNASDRFTSLQIWGGKYFEGLNYGLTEEAAIRQADDFSARIMGDRSLGQTAEIFNSKTLGFLTQFQLEVNNQWSSMIHDNKMAYKQNPGLKAGLHIANQLGQLYVASWVFNNLMKALTGSDVMFDPIDLLMEVFNPDDEDKSFEERATDMIGKIVNQLPMASIFTGGRVPISEAFKGAETGLKYLTGQTDEYGNKYTLEDVKDDFVGSFAYYLLPTGYSQLKKTTQGLGMYENELPGSYTDSGRLRFEADTSILGKMQAALFGQYASGNAREYFDKGYAPLTQKQIEEVKKLNMNVDEYREFQKDFKENTSTKNELDQIMYLDDYGNTYWYDKESRKVYNDNNKEVNVDVTTLTKASSNELKYSYIKNLPIDNEMKVDMLNSSLNKSDEILDSFGNIKYVDSKGNSFWYDDLNDKLYDSKYNLSSKNINELTKVSNLIDEDDLESFNTLEELNYSNSNPDKYLALTQVTDYNSYKSYVEKINELKDKYSNSKARKNAIISYINSLNLSKYQKMMLQKLGAGYSVSNYKAQLRKYIESLDLTAKEKQIIDNQLFGEKG